IQKGGETIESGILQRDGIAVHTDVAHPELTRPFSIAGDVAQEGTVRSVDLDRIRLPLDEVDRATITDGYSIGIADLAGRTFLRCNHSLLDEVPAVGACPCRRPRIGYNDSPVRQRIDGCNVKLGAAVGSGAADQNGHGDDRQYGSHVVTVRVTAKSSFN